jgi:BlaI family transcriptional regulator, penicillinase repressor
MLNITTAESEVMKLLWDRSPRRSEELVAELAPATGWSETTIRTLLTRLVTKGAVGVEGKARQYQYRPLVSRADYLHEESAGLINRLFDGQVGPFVAQFSEREKLSKEDIAHLKQLLERFEDGK